MAHDLVIRNGSVVDGTGAEPRRAPTSRSTATASPRSATVDGAAAARSTPTAGSSPRASSTSTPTSTPSCVGPDRLVVVLARRHVGRARQLRRHVRAVQAGRPPVPGRDDGVGRGHPGATRSWTGSPGTGRPTASTSTRSTGCRRASTSAAWSGTARCGSTRWASARSTRRPPPTRTSPRCATLVAEAIDAGALGFSTSRTALHRVPDGRLVPGHLRRRRDELLAIGEVMGDRRRGVFEAAPALGERDATASARTRARSRCSVRSAAAPVGPRRSG